MSRPTDTTGIHGTVAWFQAAVPKPTEANIHTQLGCHFEEIVEMIDALTPQTMRCKTLLTKAREANHLLAELLKGGDGHIRLHESDRTEFLDSICDQLVTAAGCAYMQRMDVVGGLNEVNRSNFSKFDDDGNPIFNDKMKIMKGPSYSTAQLAEYAV